MIQKLCNHRLLGMIWIFSLCTNIFATRFRSIDVVFNGEKFADSVYDVDESIADSLDTNLGAENRRSLAAKSKTPSMKEPLPDFTLFQKCKDTGEAYSASYLITREHLEHQFTAYNLTWVNCEMGSFIMMNGRANPDRNVNGSLLQSVDVLDFSVVHLSTYERLLRRWSKSVLSDPAAKDGNVDPIMRSAQMLKNRAMTLRDPVLPVVHPAFNRTVVIMPFLGSDMGAGHSKLSNRLQYLSACFWSFYAVYPHVVAAVKNEQDRLFARYCASSYVLLSAFESRCAGTCPACLSST